MMAKNLEQENFHWFWQSPGATISFIGSSVHFSPNFVETRQLRGND